MCVGYGSDVSAGSVHVMRVVGNTEGQPVRSLVGTIAYDARGGRLQFRVPPGARIACELDGYTAGGPDGLVTAILTTWSGP